MLKDKFLEQLSPVYILVFQIITFRLIWLIYCGCFAWQIDFFRITPGDTYNIIYTEEVIDGELLLRTLKQPQVHTIKSHFLLLAMTKALEMIFSMIKEKVLGKPFKIPS